MVARELHTEEDGEGITHSIVRVGSVADSIGSSQQHLERNIGHHLAQHL